MLRIWEKRDINASRFTLDQRTLYLPRFISNIEFKSVVAVVQEKCGMTPAGLQAF